MAQSKSNSPNTRILNFPSDKSIPSAKPSSPARSAPAFDEAADGVYSVEEAERLGLVRSMYQSSGRSSGDVITLT
jgi:hypothetical protein